MSPDEMKTRVDEIIATKGDPEKSHGLEDILLAELVEDYAPKWVHDELDRIGPMVRWYA